LDCFPNIQEQFYRTLRGARSHWNERGVSLERMLDTAMHRPDELERMVRQTGYQDAARWLLEVVRCQQFLSLEQLVRAWLTAVWDFVRGQIQLDICEQPPSAEFDARIRAMLDRLARLIAENPTRIPKRLPSPRDRPDDLDDTLGHSLL
jgi:hypothetical protein